MASHARVKTYQRDAIVKREHMPEAHRKYLSYNEDEFLSWAEQAGPSVSKVFRSFLDSGKAPEQGYKFCVSLMKSADTYGEKRVDAACERALAFSASPALRSIQAILKNGQDKLPLVQTPREQNTAPDRRPARHGIVRGTEAFRKGGVDV